MSMAPWYFKPGTEERVEVMVFRNEGGDHWGIQCPECGIHFTLRPAHGLSLGADGAISAEHSFNCPKCGNYHRHVHGGVIQP